MSNVIFGSIFTTHVKNYSKLIIPVLFLSISANICSGSTLFFIRNVVIIYSMLLISYSLVFLPISNGSVSCQYIFMSIWPTLCVPFITGTRSLITLLYSNGTNETWADPTTSESPSFAKLALSSSTTNSS